MFQTAQALQVFRRVDDSLDPQRPAVFEVLLDPGMFEERVHRDQGVPRDNARLAGCPIHDWPPMAGFRRAPGEQQLDTGGSANIEVVHDQGFEECPGMPGCVEDDRVGGSNLPHRQLPPIPEGAVVLGQRERQEVYPPVEEVLDGGVGEPIADRLKPVRILAGREPVGRGRAADPCGGGLTFGPLVPVNPDLQRGGCQMVCVRGVAPD